MPATAIELYGSRTTTTGANGSHERKYDVLGTDDEEDAIDAVVSTAPVSYGGSGNIPYMRLTSVRVEPVHIDEGNTSASRWLSTVTYSVPQGNGGGTGDQGDAAQFSFDTSGGTKHIQYSKATTDYVCRGDPPRLYRQAIEVEHDGNKRVIKGCDIVAPAFTWRETVYLSDTTVDAAYKKKLMQLTGTVNDAPFRGFEEYEVLFMGAQGSRRGDGTWELTYTFTARKNSEISLPYGDYPNTPTDILGPMVVFGHEYVWAEYQDDPATPEVELAPIGIYAEQVYDYTDFGQLYFVES